VQLVVGFFAAVLLEGLSTSFWVCRRHWIGAVFIVNLITYPAFFYFEKHLIETSCGIPLAELVIVAIEGLVLCSMYGFGSWRRMYCSALVMNAFSYGVSLLVIALQRM